MISSPQAAGTVQAPTSPQGPGPPGYHSPRLAAMGASSREGPVAPAIGAGAVAGPLRDSGEPAVVPAGSPRASTRVSEHAKPDGPLDNVEGGTHGTGSLEIVPAAGNESEDVDVGNRGSEEVEEVEEDEAAREERRALEVR